MTLHRDSSSLKLLISAGGLLCTTCCPGDLQDPNEMPSVCDNCSEVQPLQVQLDLSNFSDVGPAICTATQRNKAALYPDGTSALLNGSHILDHVSDCLYKKDISAPYVFDYWSVTQCEGEKTGTSSNTYLRMWVDDVGDGVNVSIQWLEGRQETVFFGKIPYTGDDVCFDTANTVNNTLNHGPCSSAGGVSPATGTAGITI